MTFKTIDHKDERIEIGETIKDENGKMAVVVGRYANGYRWEYVLCYMDYTLREALCERGRWQIGDAPCPTSQFYKARKKAEEMGEVLTLSDIGQRAFTKGAREYAV